MPTSGDSPRPEDDTDAETELNPPPLPADLEHPDRVESDHDHTRGMPGPDAPMSLPERTPRGSSGGRTSNGDDRVEVGDAEVERPDGDGGVNTS